MMLRLISRTVRALIAAVLAGVVALFCFDILKSRMCSTMGGGWLDLHSPTCRFLGALDTDGDQALIIGLSVVLTAALLAGIIAFRRSGKK
jgi:hypothetical protein